MTALWGSVCFQVRLQNGTLLHHKVPKRTEKTGNCRRCICISHIPDVKALCTLHSPRARSTALGSRSSVAANCLNSLKFDPTVSLPNSHGAFCMQPSSGKNDNASNFSKNFLHKEDFAQVSKPSSTIFPGTGSRTGKLNGIQWPEPLLRNRNLNRNRTVQVLSKLDRKTET